MATAKKTTEIRCGDSHCPVHARFPVRGARIEGVVVSAKAKNTIILERPYLKFVPKYERYQRRTTRIAAHKPECLEVKEGDRVLVAECRKVSKTKSFVMLENMSRKSK